MSFTPTPLGRLTRDFFTIFAVLIALITFSMLNDRISDFSWTSIAQTLGSICFLGLTLLAGPLTILVAYPSQILSVALVIAITLLLFTLSLRWPKPPSAKPPSATT